MKNWVGFKQIKSAHKLVLVFLMPVMFSSGCKRSIYPSASCPLEVGGDFGGYNYSHLCPAYDFCYEGRMNYPLDILGCNHISQAGSGAQIAIDSGNAYIRKRGGEQFLKDAHFLDMSVTYFDSAKNFANKRPLYDSALCGNTSYYLRYTYSPSGRYLYRFGIVLDKDFRVISPPSFPEVKPGTELQTLISPEEACRIATSKARRYSVPVHDLVLDYYPDKNMFIWVISQKRKVNPHNQTRVRHRFVLLNASSGKIIMTKSIRSRRVVHAHF